MSLTGFKPPNPTLFVEFELPLKQNGFKCQNPDCCGSGTAPAHEMFFCAGMHSWVCGDCYEFPSPEIIDYEGMSLDDYLIRKGEAPKQVKRRK